MTKRKMPWIAYKIHNINYVIFLGLEKERRSLIESYALLFFSIKIRSNNYGVAQ